MDAQAEHFAFDKQNDRIPVVFIDFGVRKNRIKIGGHHIFANAHKVLLIDIAVHRIADVHNRFFILQCKAKSDFDRFIDRLDALVFMYQAVGRVHDNIFDQRGDILKIILKGVAVDTAFLYNFPDADLV